MRARTGGGGACGWEPCGPTLRLFAGRTNPPNHPPSTRRPLFLPSTPAPHQPPPPHHRLAARSDWTACIPGEPPNVANCTPEVRSQEPHPGAFSPCQPPPLSCECVRERRGGSGGGFRAQPRAAAGRGSRPGSTGLGGTRRGAALLSTHNPLSAATAEACPEPVAQPVGPGLRVSGRRRPSPAQAETRPRPSRSAAGVASGAPTPVGGRTRDENEI